MQNKLTILVPKSTEDDPHGITKGSGIVALPYENEGQILYFEGNIYGAENLKSFLQKVLHAAGRAVKRYPTVAKTFLPEENKKDFLEVGTLDYGQMAENLQNRRYDGKTEEACVLEAITWSEDPEVPSLLNAWAGEEVLPQTEEDEITYRIETLQIALPKESEALVTIKNLLEELRCEGEVFSYRTTGTKAPIVSLPEGTPHGEIWDTPTEEQKAQAADENRARAKAEEAFDRHLSETQEEVEATNGWEISGNHWSRVYFVRDPENPEGPTLRSTFGIEV